MKRMIKGIKLKTWHKEISYTINSNREFVKDYEKAFDSNHNLVRYEPSNGETEWWKYNDNNKIIYYENSDGYKEKYTYDKNGNLIRKENNYNYTEIYEYNEYNDIVHYKNSDFDEEWWEYAKNGFLSSYKNNKGTRLAWYYDENNRLIHFLITADNGYRYDRWFDYDKNGNVTIHSSPIIGKIIGSE